MPRTFLLRGKTDSKGADYEMIFGENSPADYMRKYSDEALREEVERVHRYYMGFMIGQELWILKADIIKRKAQGEPWAEGEYCVIDGDAHTPMGFSDWQTLEYDCIEEARRCCPALLSPRKFFERVEYRPRPERIRRLFGFRTVDYCGLATRLSEDGRLYLTKLYEAARANGIQLLMKYDWKYSCGEGDCRRTEQREVEGGFCVESDFYAPVPALLAEVHEGAVLNVTITYRFGNND